MKKILMGTLAVATAGVLTAACSGGGNDGDSTYMLESGTYDFTVSDYPVDTCWPEATFPPANLTASFAIVSTNETSFTMAGTGITAGIVPPIAGTKTGNDLSATGNLTIAVDGTCSLTLVAGADGLMTGDNEFDADIDVNIAVATMNSAGTAAANCSHVTAIGGAVPMPAALQSSSGTCDLTLTGSAVLQ